MISELDKILIKYDQPDFEERFTEIRDSRFQGYPFNLTARKINN